MSFDIDPKDHSKRILALHDGTGVYFECKTQAEFDSYCQHEIIDDVTGIEIHEKAFKQQQKENL